MEQYEELKSSDRQKEDCKRLQVTSQAHKQAVWDYVNSSSHAVSYSE